MADTAGEGQSFAGYPKPEKDSISKIYTGALTRDGPPIKLVPAQSHAPIRRELLEALIRQPSLLPIKVIVIVRVGLVPQFEAERVRVVRPDALLLLLLPPRVVPVPAFRHGKLYALGAVRSPARGHLVGIARPSQGVGLRVVEVAVFEEVVAGRVGGLLGAFAVAFCDVQHVAPVIELVGRRWPVSGFPGVPVRLLSCGEQREDE